MPIEFRCGQCGRLLKTPDDTAGRQAQCPACGSLSTVPGAQEPQAPPPPLPAEGPPAPGTWVEPVAAGGSPTGPSPTGPAGAGVPYATPFAGDSAQASALSRQFAADRVSGPATALTVVAWLNLILSLLLIVCAIVILAAGPHFGGKHQIWPPPNQGDLTFQAISWLVSGPIAIAVSIFLLIGAAKMRRLESYGLALATAIIAVVPCTAPCCIVGMGFGIWALVVLCDANVKSAFRT
jgi:phage FluMu protein Com